ncbi:MAG: hypothetical protein MUO63_10305 [Desulfobulbaceae bacterium]|nr:hypothetical protein [Desulfobulbaceae bacterium]
MRSIKPEHGRNDRDKKARERKQSEILNQAATYKEIPNHGVFPNFSPEHEAGPEGYIGVLIPEKDLEKLTEKIVRGITFIENGYLN